jgi:hypothetical protein
MRTNAFLRVKKARWIMRLLFCTGRRIEAR